MNLLVTLERYIEYKKVLFYTLHIEDAELSETESFFIRFNEPTYKEHLAIIKSWIQQIGERGAKENYFRPEKNAGALPPKFVKSTDFRLYCIRISNDIVILCNGGIKTAKSAQDCSNVGPIFKFVNKVESALREKILNQEIKVDVKCLLGDLTLDIPY